MLKKEENLALVREQRDKEACEKIRSEAKDFTPVRRNKLKRRVAKTTPPDRTPSISPIKSTVSVSTDGNKQNNPPVALNTPSKISKLPESSTSTPKPVNLKKNKIL